MTRIIRIAAALAVVLSGSAFLATPSAVAAPAAASHSAVPNPLAARANPGGCQGQVMELVDVGARIKLRYRVICQTATSSNATATCRASGW